MDSHFVSPFRCLKKRRTLVTLVLFGLLVLILLFLYLYREIVVKPGIFVVLSATPKSLTSLNTLSNWSKSSADSLVSFKEEDIHKNAKLHLLKTLDIDIKEELVTYNFTGISDPPNLASLQIKYGGDPVKAVIFATWRSGSTFLGDLASSHPSTFYHYEPLLHLGVHQARGQYQTRGLHVIEQLLACNYSDIPEFNEWQSNVSHERNQQNKRLWLYCQKDRRICEDPDFVGEMCKTFPFLSMKTVRMRLTTGKALLENASLRNIRVLLLVRDPRAIMHSRKGRDWCARGEDCTDPEILCRDMDEDWKQAKLLRDLYPNRAIRYEDLSLHPFKAAKKILRFFHFQMHPDVTYFLQTHTVKAHGGMTSTYRDSAKTPFHWIEDTFRDNKSLALMNIETNLQLNMIETACSSVLQHWGYELLPENRNMISTWKPLKQPPWPEMFIY